MNFKTITHWFAVGIAALAGFAVTPAGQAVARQYPKLSVVFGALGALAALYHNPKVTSVLLLCLLLGGPCAAQQQPAAPPSPLFSCSTDAIGVRLGGTTNPGTDVNCAFNVTKTIAAETHNLLVPATGGQDYFGGVSWTPDLSKLFARTTLPKNTFQPFIHAAFGAARTVPVGSTALQHYGGFAGVGVRYDPTGSGRFTITPIRFDWYNHPGIAKSPNGWLVGAGIQYVFGQKQ